MIKSMVLRRLKFGICCILGISSMAKASECEGILGYIRDQTSISTSSTTNNNYYRVMCEREESSFASAKSSQASVGIIIEDLPTEIGGSSRDSEWSTYKKTLCEEIKTGKFSDNRVQIIVSKANAQVVDAWKSCVTSAGLHFYISSADSNASIITLFASYIPSGSISATKAKAALAFTPPDAIKKCGNLVIMKGTIINAGGLGINCERDISKNLLITLNTLDGVKTIFLPSIAKSNAPVACQSPQLKVFTATGGVAGLPRAEVKVDSGYKIVGGGANDEWGEEGNYLTSVYPETLQKWVATGKAHLRLAEGKITAWAIAIYDPSDEWDVKIFTHTGEIAGHSQAIASVDAGYVLIGGGARSNWTGLGSMLTGSFPVDSQSWMAESHDHLEQSPSNTTAFAIGIRPVKCNWSGGVKIFSSTSEVAMLQKASLVIDKNYKIASMGARTISSNPGTLLTGIVLEKDGASALAKPHLVDAYGQSTVYVIGIR